MIRTICLMIAMFCVQKSFAQLQGQLLVDSLEKVAPGMRDDSNKVKAYSRISQIYYSLNPMKTFTSAEKALSIAEKIGWKKGMANMHNNLGLFISDTGNYQLGNEHYRKSFEINKEIGLKPNEINNLNNLGRNYMAVSDFANAADYFFQALTVAESIKSDDQIALVGTNLISCFYRQKNYLKATEYANLTIKHAKLADNSRHLVNGLMQLGATQLELKDTVAARTNLRQAMKICEETSNYSDLAKVLLNLSVAEYPDYKKSMDLMLRVDTIVSQTGPGTAVDMNNNFTMADVYHRMALQSTGAERSGYLANASLRLKKAKTIADGSVPEMMVGIYSLEGDLQEEAGNYKAALASFKKANSTADSLFSQDKKNEIAGLEGKHDIAIKDKEIELNKLIVLGQRKTQWALIAAIIFVAIIAGLIYWQSRARKKTNITLMVLNDQLDEANKVKARFFGILSHDLRSPIVNLVHFLELQKNSPDLLSEEDKVVHTVEISESAENLLNTMEAMLLWSKEQMENFKPNIQSIAVADLFDHVRNFFGEPAHIRMSFVVEPGLNVLGDENYLRTIMQNLTSNAIRALKNTEGASINWEAKSTPGGVELSITDNGPGITADKVKTLFDTNTVINEKTGFGLHLVRDLAKAIKYNISVHSQPGHGTRFTLSN